MEVRPMRKTDLGAYGELCRYCFLDTQAADDAVRYMTIVGEHIGHTWGAFDHGTMLAGLWYYPYKMRVGQGHVPAGGIAAVATWPEYRNRGIVRELMTNAHRQMRAEGCPLAILNPFKSVFYSRMGYANTFFHQDHLFAPAQIRTDLKSHASLRVIKGTSQWELLEDLHQRCSACYTGPVVRDARYWETRYLSTTRGVRRICLVERYKQPVGFLITTLTRVDEIATLRVNQAAWVDADALIAILGFLRNLRDQVKEIRWFLPVDVDLFPYFDDLRDRVRLCPKMMLKLADLKGAIQTRVYPEDFNAELLLDVAADPTSPWNAGRWRVSWRQGRAEVRKAAKMVAKVPVLKTDIQTLATIFSGHRSASSLVHDELLKASGAVVEIMDRAFPAGVPYMEEWF